MRSCHLLLFSCPSLFNFQFARKINFYILWLFLCNWEIEVASICSYCLKKKELKSSDNNAMTGVKWLKEPHFGSIQKKKKQYISIPSIHTKVQRLLHQNTFVVPFFPVHSINFAANVILPPVKSLCRFHFFNFQIQVFTSKMK